MSSKLKIALVSAFPPGKQSLNEYGLHLANGLAARDDVAEVVVIADILPAAAAELNLGPKIRVERVWRFNALSAAPAMLTALLREKVDGVIWNLQIASFGDREISAALGLMAPALARFCRIPSGVIAHNLVAGVDLEETHLKGQPIRQRIVQFGGAVVTRALLNANYLTVTLRSYADNLRKNFPNKPVHLVPHGTFDVSVKDTMPLNERSKRIVTMGKFGTYKRLETLIAAFESISQESEYADYELVIGGTDHPNTPGYMAELAQRHSANPKIKFHGYVAEDDVPEFFADARLSVFDYSATTGSSGVLHQTVSYGTMPVFPYIGDFVDVCSDEGITGFNYSPDDAQSMAQAIETALSDLSVAQEMADANRAAAMDMPFSDVVDFHMRQLAQIKNERPIHKSAPASA